MKKYELMTITKVALSEQGAKDVTKQMTNFITSQGGTVEKDDFWGKRKLAYEIKRNTEGYYSVLQFSANPESITKIKGKLNLNTDIIRYLITAKS